MSVNRNPHWFGQNATRSYPVEESATGLSVPGVRLPFDLLCDLHLRWPERYGRYAFLGAATVTPTLVTLTIQAADSPDAESGFSPLAVFTALRPVAEGRVLPLQPQVVGVSGWLVLGSGANGEPYTGRFAGPAASRLVTRAARAYRELPVASIGTLGASPQLTGIVTWRAEEPLALARESREIAGVLRDCLVFRLVETSATPAIPSAALTAAPNTTSVFQQFAGPCAGRPESRTCGSPEPIEFINGVAPDCDGLITLAFSGCAQLAAIAGGDGIAVDCGFGLVNACTPVQIPSEDGLLPNEYTPANPEPPPDPTVPPDDFLSESFQDFPLLPHVDCFQPTADLTVQRGTWANRTDSEPSECPYYLEESLSLSTSASVSASYSLALEANSFGTTSSATRNLATWEGLDDTAVFRKVTIAGKMLAGGIGDRHNLRLIANYRPHDTLAGLHTYFSADLDYDSQRFRALRFNGVSDVVLATAAIPALGLDTWYKIELTVRAVGGTTELHARVTSVGTNIVETSITVSTTNYAPSTGRFGIGTENAISNFGYLIVEEVPDA